MSTETRYFHVSDPSLDDDDVLDEAGMLAIQDTREDILTAGAVPHSSWHHVRFGVPFEDDFVPGETQPKGDLILGFTKEESDDGSQYVKKVTPLDLKWVEEYIDILRTVRAAKNRENWELLLVE